MLPEEANDGRADADLVATALDWAGAGHGVALATVVRTWGSSPCPAGSHLVIRDDNLFEGSVSGGCIEGEVVTEALAAIRKDTCTTLEFGISNEDAWRVGLACGGTVEVFVANLSPARLEVLAALREARREKRAAATLTDLEGGAMELSLRDGAGEALAARFLSDRSGMVETPAGARFVRVYNPPLRLFIVGAVHIAQALAAMAAETGYDVVVIDPRDTWGTPERFPGVKLDRRWPSTALADHAPDARTAVVTLCHDPKLDDPALVEALKSEAFYIGSLGSTRTHAKRLERLVAEGFDDKALARIHGPLGLDIGAQTPAEIALSAMAQITEALRRSA